MQLALLIPLVLLPSQTPRPSAAAAAPVAQKDTLEARVDALAAEALAKPGAAGLSVAIARRGKLELAKGYGLADAEFDVPANAETCFRIGSVTKQFTAAAIMKAVEQGQLTLDDSLAKFVPDFDLLGNTVTIRQLLNHTSGIPSYTDIGEEWVAKWPLELSHEELLALVEGQPFTFPPGTDWAYNNTGYYLLGMVLEKLSGKSYAEHLLETQFEPLGLTRTRYDSNKALIKNRAQGYGLSKLGLENDEPLGMSQPGAAGALLSTAGDLVRWSMALSSGKVVSPASFAAMTAPTVLPGGRDTGYGFGLAIDQFEGRQRIQHGGGIHGFNSMLAWIPEGDVHVAVISNGERVSSGKLAEELCFVALGIEKPKVKDEPLSAEQRKKYVGNYRMEALGMNLRVYEEGEQLKAQADAPGQGAFRLRFQGKGEFRADFDDNVRLLFDDEAKEFTLFQGGGSFKGLRKG